MPPELLPVILVSTTQGLKFTFAAAGVDLEPEDL
jgi:hypothetical protein